MKKFYHAERDDFRRAWEAIPTEQQLELIGKCAYKIAIRSACPAYLKAYDEDLGSIAHQAWLCVFDFCIGNRDIRAKIDPDTGAELPLELVQIVYRLTRTAIKIVIAETVAHSDKVEEKDEDGKPLDAADLAGASSLTAATLPAVEDAAELGETFNELFEICRDDTDRAIVGGILGGTTYAEIADQLKLTTSQIARRVYRLRREFQK